MNHSASFFLFFFTAFYESFGVIKAHGLFKEKRIRARCRRKVEAAKRLQN